MKALRIIATLVTGSMMFAGGILLAMTGPSLVIALGIASAAVGALYTFAGITAERTIRPTTPPTTPPVASNDAQHETQTTAETVPVS